MNEQRMPLQSVRVRNVKAIVDSRTVRFGPLTAFVGHNGGGKSSLIDALETYQSIIVDGLDVTMQRWLGIKHLRHLGAEATERTGKALNEMAFDLRWRTTTIPSAPNPIATCKPGGRG